MTTPPTAGGPAAPAPGAGEHGVIHDIGYRHYDGPRLGRSAVRRALYVDSARGAYGLGRAGRTKVVPALLLAAMCLPALGVAIVAAVTGLDDLPLDYPDYVLNLQVLVAVFVATQAPVSVSRDLRFGVLALHFSRPMRRTDYVLAKYGALATAVFVLCAIPLTLLLAGALLAELPAGDQLLGWARALGGAAIGALVVAGVGLVIASVTPRRGLGVAAIVSVLLVLSGVQAVVRALAGEQGSDTAALYSGLLSPFTLVDGVTSAVLRSDGAFPAADYGVAATVVFILVAEAVVAGAYGLLVLRYRKVSIS